MRCLGKVGTIFKLMLLVIFMGTGVKGNAQLLQWNTFGNAGTETTEPSVFNDPNISSANLTQGTITATANGNRFGGSGWFNTGNTAAGNTLAEAVAGNDYIQFIVTPNSGFSFTATSFVFSWDHSATGPSSLTLRSSNDGFVSDLGTVTGLAASITSGNTITISGLTNITAATTFRLYGYGATGTGGTGGFDVASNLVNIQLNGTTTSTTPVTPIKLTITSISPTTPAPSTTFSATVQAQDGTNAVGNVSANTDFTLTTNGNAGTIGGTVTGTILAGTGSVIVSGITLSTAGTGVTLTATRTAGDALTPGISAPFNVAVNSSATDYFRSNVTTGDWATPASWQSSTSSGGPWNTATLAPTSSASGINIQATHTINITNAQTINNTVVNGILTMLNGGVNAGSITLANNGSVDELTVNNGGIFKIVSSSATYASAINYNTVSGNILVNTGGIISIGDGAGGHSAGGYAGFGLENSSFVKWSDGAILEWNSTNVQTLSTSAVTYFPSNAAGVKSIIRISKTMGGTFGAGAGNYTVINGILEINANTTIQGAGTKTFRDGIKGTATFTLASTLGTTTISGIGAILGGTSLTLIINQTLNVSNGIEVPLGASVLLSNTSIANITKAGGSFLVNGSIDITDRTISNTSGDVTINGILKTSHLSGLYNPGNIASGSIFLNAGSTIEYNAASGIQSITGTTVLGQSYYNITFSGAGGTKTPINLVNVNTLGTVKITGGTNVNFTSYNIGSVAANTTAFIMDGTGVLTLGTAGSLPLMDGIYTLTSGIVRYAGTSQTIRSKSYQNIEVTGTGVGNSSGNITLNANGTFNVKNTGVGTGGTFSINDNAITCPSGGGTVTVENSATFKTGNNEGFSGFAATFTNNSSIHSNILASNIILAAGSTVDYAGTSAQKISNQIPYQNFAISATAAVNKIAPGSSDGDLIIKGNITKGTGATFLHNNGTVSLEGTSAQTYTATDGGMEFYTLVNKNTSGTGFNVNNNLGVVNQFILSPTGRTASSVVTFGAGNINLRSSSSQTANIPDLGTTNTPTINYTGIGRFQIERYLPFVKSWRLLAAPIVQEGLTITDAWREGGSAVSNGYGTQITGPSPASTGMDEITPRGSMKWYNKATNTYTEVLNTADPIAKPQGYYVFVRGDRAQNVAGAGSTTNLRMKGKILTGAQTFSALVPTGAFDGFESVGNPYPSQINYKTVSKTNLEPAYTVWNPNGGFYGVGRFVQYVSTTGLNGDYVNGGNTVNTIESGQAFFIQSAVGVAGGITINESDKSTGSNTVSRNETENKTGVTVPTLEVNLHEVVTSDSANFLDHVVLNFDDSYSNSFDGNDVRKFMNSTDNLAIKMGIRNLILERRTPLTIADTIYLSLTNTRIASYHFKIDPSVLGNLPLNAFLLDKFLMKETPVSLTSVTTVPFSITSDAASKVADRFKIVFRQGAAGPLPGTFTGIAAEVNIDKTNTIKWFVSNEVNLTAYVIERSANNVGFDEIGSRALAGNTTYSFIDANPLAALNYYRVKATATNGQVRYSAIVKLSNADTKPGFTIQPNPVINKTLHVNFKNMEGLYSIRLTSKQGATVLSKQITIAAGSQTKSIELGNAVAAGVYDVLLVDAKGKQTIQAIFVQ